MEKLLAMSILSSTPSEIKSGGFSSWMNMTLRKKSNQDSNDDSKSEKSESEKKKEVQQKNLRSARIAPEFDGLNCFETIVSH